jgi:hypothetical protein
MVIGSVDHLHVATTVSEHDRACRHSGQMHRALLKPRKGAPGAVRVEQGDCCTRRPGDRNEPIRTGSLEAHERTDARAVQLFEHLNQHPALVAAEDPFVRELQRTEEATRHDQCVVRQVPESDNARGSSLPHRDKGHQQTRFDVPSRAGGQ